MKRRSLIITLLLLSFVELTLAQEDMSAKISIGELIEQFKGEKCYLDSYGKEVGFFDSWTTRNFKENCKITAARYLGKRGEGNPAVAQLLLNALKHGHNDIDTGDGILPYRSTIALALGELREVKAISILIEKLKIEYIAKLSDGAAYPPNWKHPTGVGHCAIIKALGMFGPRAVKALPLIRTVKKVENPKLYREICIKEAVETALKQIEGESQ